MASGAGLNRVEGVLLSNIPSSVTAVALGTNGVPTGYGTIGLNDSGFQLVEGRDFTKWTTSLTGTSAGLSVLVLGCNDPLVYAAFKLKTNPSFYQINNQPIPSGMTTATTINGSTVYEPPAASWFILDSPSAQSGTGVVANPMTNASPLLQFSGALKAVRVVVVGNSSYAGGASVNAEVAP